MAASVNQEGMIACVGALIPCTKPVAAHMHDGLRPDNSSPHPDGCACVRASLADIGTSSKQWGDGKNWSDAPDVCRGNEVRQNYIRTRVRPTVLYSTFNAQSMDNYGCLQHCPLCSPHFLEGRILNPIALVTSLQITLLSLRLGVFDHCAVSAF